MLADGKQGAADGNPPSQPAQAAREASSGSQSAASQRADSGGSDEEDRDDEEDVDMGTSNAPVIVPEAASSAAGMQTRSRKRVAESAPADTGARDRATTRARLK